MSVVQSILFDSKMWDVREAVRWLQENEFKASKIDETLINLNKSLNSSNLTSEKRTEFFCSDETVNFYRFRQVSPTSLKNKGYTEYRVKKLKNGIDFVLAFKPTIHSEDCI